VTPVVATTRDELDAALKTFRPGPDPIGLVPTMGALHAGHALMLRETRARSRATVVSIFVNPLQFGPTEDYGRYPRDLAADLDACSAEGVAVVFVPDTTVIYPDGALEVTIDPGPLGRELEGASRPGHFSGVLTVVAKLFGLVRPDFAVFGEKDYQQLALVRTMVRDLDMGVDVLAIPTVRERDGLALSSRNRYLSDGERVRARALPAALRAGTAAAPHGPDAVRAAALAELSAAESVELDYLEVRDPALRTVAQTGQARLLLAARVGTTRLIDNAAIDLGDGGPTGFATSVGSRRTSVG
jgi:pantoate--beta-alanine ligase